MKWRVEYPTVPRGWPPEFSVVQNRSDRVWVYGWLRLAPPLLWIGGLLLTCVLGRYVVPTTPWIAIVALALAFIVPIILDRSRLLDPVDFIALGPSTLYVKRLTGRQASFAADVSRVEFTKPENEDYDERQRSRRYLEVAFRFYLCRPYRMLVTPEDATRISKWADANGISAVERAV